MNSFLYDIAKNIIPVIIIGTLGYFAKQFLDSKSAYKWRHISASVIIVVGLSATYLVYQNGSSPYIRQYTPEDTLILGATTYSDFDGSFWLLEPGKVISMPLYVRPNRLVYLKAQFDAAPLEIEYKAGNATHKLTITDKNTLILNNVLVEDLLSNGIKLSTPVNESDERVFPFKFKVDRQTKMLFYEFGRRFPTSILLVKTLSGFMMIMFVSSALISVIYLYPKKPLSDGVVTDKNPNKQNSGRKRGVSP